MFLCLALFMSQKNITFHLHMSNVQNNKTASKEWFSILNAHTVDVACLNLCSWKNIRA